MVIKNCTRRHTGLAIDWINYREAFDMVPHSWILKYMKMPAVAENIIKLIEISMSHWNTNLTYGNERLGN